MSLFAERLHDPALIEEAYRLRAQNLSIRAISERTGIPHSTLGGYLKGEGEAFYEMECAHCGEPILAFRPHRRYCSKRCEVWWKRINVPGYDEEYRAMKCRANKRQREARKALL